VDLYEGWNLIPVLCQNGMTIEELDLQLGDNLVFIQEAAGNAIYWPDMNIQTIDLLEPGKAYLVLVSVDTTLDFSTCGY
jgi:hypothetical protein